MNPLAAEYALSQALNQAALFAAKETKAHAEQQGEIVLELLEQAAQIARATPTSSGARRGIDVYA